jgi:4-amino-4-deoxy-L-arabinose transferase-like glycosyltransferase
MVALAAIYALGVWLRYNAFIIAGGLEPDYLAWARQNYFGGIAGANFEDAKRLASGQGFGSPSYPIGYSAFLAGLDLLGLKSAQEMRLAQVWIDALTCLLLYWTASRMFASRAGGLVAAALYAGFAPQVFGSSTLLAEALSPLLVVSTMTLLWRYREHPTLAGALLTGAFVAIAGLFRQDLILMAGPALLWIVWHSPGLRVQRSAILLAGFSAVMLPVGFHNLQEHGVFRLTGGAGFYALWSGLGQTENSYGYYVNDTRAAAETKALGIRWHSPEMESYFRDKYLAAWRDHPEYVLRTILERLQRIPFAHYAWSVDPPPAKQIATTWGLLFLMVALPLAYAMASLGPLYFEDRYTRYASVSYLLAIAAVVSILIGSLQTRFRPWGGATARTLAFATLALLAFAQIRAFQEGSTRTVDAFNLLAEAKSAPAEAWAELGPGVRWTTVVPGASLQRQDATTIVSSDTSLMSYQALHPLPVRVGDSFVLEMTIEQTAGDGAFGAFILSGDSTKFLDQYAVARTGAQTVRLLGTRVTTAPPQLGLSNMNPKPAAATATVRNIRLWTKSGAFNTELLDALRQRDALGQALANPSTWTSYPLRGEWQKAVPGVSYADAIDGSLKVSTDVSTSSYQILRPLAGGPGPFAFRIDLSVAGSGQVVVGLLTNDQSRFIDQSASLGAGDHAVTLFAMEPNAKPPWLLLTTANAKPVSADVTLRSASVIRANANRSAEQEPVQNRAR